MRNDGITLSAALFFGEFYPVQRKRGSPYISSSLCGRLEQRLTVHVAYRSGLKRRVEKVAEQLRKNGYPFVWVKEIKLGSSHVS